jgi:hypothetical protein
VTGTLATRRAAATSVAGAPSAGHGPLVTPGPAGHARKEGCAGPAPSPAQPSPRTVSSVVTGWPMRPGRM